MTHETKYFSTLKATGGQDQKSNKSLRLWATTIYSITRIVKQTQKEK